MNLDLRTPLIYAALPDKSETAGIIIGTEDEILLCFDLDPRQSRSIEPDPQLLLGPLVFAGRTGAGDFNDSAFKVSLPAGNYLFVQRRGAVLSREEWLDMAIEQQKDGLWERNKPESRIFVRYLYEDGQPVTQLFRPLEGCAD